MDPADLSALKEEWQRNERELEALRLLPTGQVDPAERERQLDARQDEIEYEIGLEALKSRRQGSDLGDGV